MKKQESFDLTIKMDDDEHGEITVYCEGKIGAFYPATMYRSNGDPGDAAEGGEITFTKEPVMVTDDGKEFPFDGDWESLEDAIYQKVGYW